ncbi:MAG: hypothetical protein M1820_001617 [Bogoriella megaspora]|nr:MAG: hypothetical protein M1820_001617 [Bogoriella megaspora]
MARSTISRLVGILATTSFLSPTYAAFGASWDSLEDQNSPSYIISAVTTIRVPPKPAGGLIMLWPGLYTTEPDLVQTIIASFANPTQDKQTYQGCNGKDSDWCVFASEYKGGSHNNVGSYAPVSKDDMVTIKYTYQEESQTWNQQALKNGVEISSFSSNAAQHAYRWGPYVECQQQAEINNQPSPGHTYHNTKIVLNAPNPNYGQSLQKKYSHDTGFQTPDGGKTWQVATIWMETSPCAQTQLSDEAKQAREQKQQRRRG